MKKIKVYIAGPYSRGDKLLNTRTAMGAWNTLFDLGLFPFCPHLTHFLDQLHPRPYESWMAYDQEWLKVCHVLLRLPGLSKGSKREEKLAKSLGIPVFHTIKEVQQWAANQ